MIHMSEFTLLHLMSKARFLATDGTQLTFSGESDAADPGASVVDLISIRSGQAVLVPIKLPAVLGSLVDVTRRPVTNQPLTLHYRLEGLVRLANPDATSAQSRQACATGEVPVYWP